ncbi:phosphoribosylglycinamide formyltransferase [Aquimarina gracilis]|uniref:Phosphoribosylglycinamide formyltransferase n=1 Tax=Aquimarina gracilis TaxID=874422 RepID=A0ABU6A168_9FLAO|nr:phosphoribosylglycinamide formyltransferase [Aquimarina gracilis]MEB3347864.1 phosphoribosylglycinamide formyltransferase [Aquimarina gracilis]
MKRIVIFASGSGTNAENIIKYFHERKNAEVTHVFSNSLRAKVLKRAYDLEVKALHFDREAFYDTNDVLNILKDANPDLIVLAGFLWIFPKKIIDAFPNKVINIHPALLPKYGGKGMYGHHVHEAVIRNKEIESGITIHYVNEKYDEGAIIFQAKTVINENDSAEDVAKAIHKLEYKHFPVVIEELLFPEK